MAQTKRIIAGGFNLLQYARVSASGYPDGTSLTAIAAGGDDGMGRLYGVKSANVSIPAAERKFQTGDNTSQGSIMYQTNELPNGQMTTGIFDHEYDAFCVGHKVYALNNGTAISPLGGADVAYSDQLMILTRDAKSKETATSGLSRYESYVLPAANVDAQGSDGFAEREFANGQYSITCNKAAKFPWGAALSASNVGTTEAPIYRFITDGVPCFHTHIGNGADTTFTLDHLPKSDHTGIYFTIFTFADGADAAAELASVNTGTGAVTFTLAPANDVVHVVFYQYDL